MLLRIIAVRDHIVIQRPIRLNKKILIKYIYIYIFKLKTDYRKKNKNKKKKLQQNSVKVFFL